MTTAISASVSVATSSGSSKSGLVKMASGEYTASSVSSDQTDAAKLGLVKEKDGNYGTSKPTAVAASSAATRSSSGVQSALASLTLGGT